MNFKFYVDRTRFGPSSSTCREKTRWSDGRFSVFRSPCFFTASARWGTKSAPIDIKFEIHGKQTVFFTMRYFLSSGSHSVQLGPDLSAKTAVTNVLLENSSYAYTHIHRAGVYRREILGGYFTPLFWSNFVNIWEHVESEGSGCSTQLYWCQNESE